MGNVNMINVLKYDLSFLDLLMFFWITDPLKFYHEIICLYWLIINNI